MNIVVPEQSDDLVRYAVREKMKLLRSIQPGDLVQVNEWTFIVAEVNSGSEMKSRIHLIGPDRSITVVVFLDYFWEVWQGNLKRWTDTNVRNARISVKPINDAIEPWFVVLNDEIPMIASRDTLLGIDPQLGPGECFFSDFSKSTKPCSPRGNHRSNHAGFRPKQRR